MKTLVCTTPGEFEYQDVQKPVLKKGHAILKIKRIGICGTDLHAFEGTQPFFSYPRVLGHELAAEVEAIDGEGFKKGEVVTFIPYYHCGECIACRTGKTNCCANIEVCGVHTDGGMTEYLQVPADLLIKGNGLDFDALALIEPLAIGAHGIRRAGVRGGEYVLVIGAGPIGLGIMKFAEIAGGRVIAMDVNPIRLDFCRHTLKIAHTINAEASDVMEQLRQITGGDLPTVVIDATGNRKAINAGFEYMAHGARYVLVGLQKGDINFNHPEFHKKEATLMSSRNATREDFEHVVRCMERNMINPTDFITHRVEFNQVKNEFASWLDPKNGVIKAMVAIENHTN